jgi:hypothetical protein
MTQMMLFDTTCSLNAASPSVSTPSVAAPATTATTPRPQRSGRAEQHPSGEIAEAAIAGRRAARSSRPAAPQPRPVTPQSDEGLHTMGDLARLVLLRYQLVAKRREALAAGNK